ncbi:MAG: hypothetical protein LC729_00250, partial [Acidobacteria bacterium]|nr:hypothetical protein [Acidobacteriota bacterium]
MRVTQVRAPVDRPSLRRHFWRSFWGATLLLVAGLTSYIGLPLIRAWSDIAAMASLPSARPTARIRPTLAPRSNV